VIIIVIANTETPDLVEDDNPSRLTLADQRTRPIGEVRTEVPAEPVPVAVAAPVDPADIDGAAIYAQVCQACHVTGAAGAPIPGTDAWAERAAKGEEVLLASAINGLNAMPAKGGRMDMSDAEIKAAVEHMLAQ
jgi:cytochrome c5